MHPLPGTSATKRKRVGTSCCGAIAQRGRRGHLRGGSRRITPFLSPLFQDAWTYLPTSFRPSGTPASPAFASPPTTMAAPLSASTVALLKSFSGESTANCTRRFARAAPPPPLHLQTRHTHTHSPLPRPSRVDAGHQTLRVMLRNDAQALGMLLAKAREPPPPPPAAAACRRQSPPALPAPVAASFSLPSLHRLPAERPRPVPLREPPYLCRHR